MTLAQHFAAYSEWRAELSGVLEKFAGWLVENELADAQTDRRIAELLEKLREDRLHVAFVAEFSRGKSELINALFFANYGNRVLPSTAGRTTMCPTELMFDRTRAPSIELLPIETREANASISEYKRFPDEWEIIPLDTASAEAMQDALRHVSDVIRVDLETAKKLGFAVGEGDAVRVSRRRGRNARGSALAPCDHQFPASSAGAGAGDPRHTRPQRDRHRAGVDPVAAAQCARCAVHPGRRYGRHAVRSDRLARTHRSAGWTQEGPHRRSEQDRQPVGRTQVAGRSRCRRSPGRSTLARGRSIARRQIFPVSAQKALVAKINDDADLLRRSRLGELEHALSEELIPAKQEIVRDNTDSEFSDCYLRTRSLLESRLASLREQVTELTELRGKNKGVVEYMMGKVRVEKEEFESGLQRYYAVRSVFSQLTNNLFAHLGLDSLRLLTTETRDAMQHATFSKTLSAAMAHFFEVARGNLSRSEGRGGEIRAMMEAIYKKFAVEHGLKLGAPIGFSLMRYSKEIDRIDQWCRHARQYDVPVVDPRKGPAHAALLRGGRGAGAQELRACQP
jgi:hypothetical protein